MVVCDDDTCDEQTQVQMLGIDRIIVLASGKTIRIDEKKRRSTWPDILLEYVSNDRYNTPGWIEKPLQIDYLAYALMPSQRVYLFPWDLLRRAWLDYREEWLDAFPTKRAANAGYNTLSVAIPTNLLLKAVSNAAIVQL